jgi:two-component system, OmpR family, sensor histidine kinase CiaH
MSLARANTSVFGYIGRRMALVNAAVVLLLIAVVGIGMVAVARYVMIQQADQALKDQANVAALDWGPNLATGQPIPVADRPIDGDGDGHDGDDELEAEELLDSGDLIAFGFDAQGTLVANPRGMRMTELPEQQAVVEALTGHDGYQTVSLHDEPDVRVYTMPIEVDHQVVGAVQIVRNQKDLRSAIRAIELAALVAAAIGALGAVPTGLYLAKRAMRPIDRAFRRQQAFIADASHELRTPLAVVRANTELVRRMPDATPQERDVELAAILEETDRMARLVDELLVLARSDAGRLELKSEVLDLSALVREAAEPMRALAAEAGQTLEIDAPDELLISGDEDRLAQILRILIGNAIAYTPAGGTIRVVSGRGTVDRGQGTGDSEQTTASGTPKTKDQRPKTQLSTVHRPLATLTVADTGIGMSAEERARVFDRFYRGEQSRSRGTGGVGLGLSIAQTIVESHHGTITIDSEPGKGTTVRVSLPRLGGSF